LELLLELSSIYITNHMSPSSHLWANAMVSADNNVP